MLLTRPRPGSALDLWPAHSPPGIATFVGSAPRETKTSQEEVLWSWAPKTPFARARARSTSWQPSSVLTVVLNASKRRPAASVQRPWPMKTGMPLALTSSSKISAAFASVAAPTSRVRQMSKMQSLSMRASCTSLHFLLASRLSSSGQLATTSSRCFSSAPGEMDSSEAEASKRAAVSTTDAGEVLPLKRFRLLFTAPRSSPMGMFQEGTMGFASSSGSPFKLPQNPPCLCAPCGRGMVMTTDMKSTPVMVISMPSGNFSENKPPVGFPAKRSLKGPMLNLASVRMSSILSLWRSESHSLSLRASKIPGSRNSSTSSLRMRAPSKSTSRCNCSVSL
mmetsp:Transcript_68742/g.182832  ORF Transcript_68742/g.182832 Transcript_68742/m.182832 type:complete len:336 (+) Transcript_68742:69-1076(+)